MSNEIQTEVEVRRLNNKDLWRLVKIIKAGGVKAIEAMKEAESDEARTMVILDVGLEYAEKDVKDFLADLGGLTLEQYDKASYTVTLDIVEKVQEQDDIAAFFKRTAALAGKFQSKNKKDLTK